MFELNRDWYAKNKNDDNCNIIYQPPPSEDVWIDKKGHRDLRHELENQRRCLDDQICKKNRVVPDIIFLNTKDIDASPPMGSPVSDENISVDY